jgi:chaperone required for assembly of F1-ATPase
MKRFYRNAVSEPVPGGYEILLDGRGVKSPARAPLIAPSERLGQAIADDWNGQGETVNPRSMPLTGLANAAIDRVVPDPAAFVRGLAVFGESDLLCYRADQPRGLVARQSDEWDPLLAWARRRYDVDFEVVTGIMHRPQPERTVSQLAKAAAVRGAFELAALSPLVTVSGSLIIALALAEDEISLETAWSAATLDEQWQLEQWGADAEAEKALDARRHDFDAGYRLLKLL